MKAFAYSCIGLLVLCKLVVSQTDYTDESTKRDVQSVLSENIENADTDLRSSASERFLDLSSLFNKGYNTNSNRPYYPSGYNPSYYPTGSGYYPQSGGYYPNSGYPSAYPSAGYPSAGYPSAGYPTSGYPNTGYGTNVLGGAGGLGGYGGYGGNGGLSSYNGYNRNDYYGNRNVGFGYYDGTNANGFYRTPTSVIPAYVSGYRGYN